MIKFFRKIRFDLMQNNNTGRYLKYAIGEIILVVIGILIALQINNWNQAYQIKNNNKLYLTKMLKDLNFIDERLNSIIYTYSKDNNSDYPSLNEAIRDCDSLLKLTYRGLQKKDLEYLINAEPDQGGTLLNINDNTYKELLNTGKLYSLGSEDLVEAIQNYYKLCERETEYQKQNIEDMERGLIKFEDGFNLLFMDYEHIPNDFNIKNYPYYFNKDSKEYKNYQLGLSLMLNSQKNNMQKMENIIEATRQLKIIIQKHLD